MRIALTLSYARQRGVVGEGAALPCLWPAVRGVAMVRAPLHVPISSNHHKAASCEDLCKMFCAEGI